MKFIRSIAAALIPIALLASMAAYAQEISSAGARVPVSIPNGGTGAATLPTGALKGAGTGAITQAQASDLSNGVTGTGAVMLAANPSSSGTLTASGLTVTFNTNLTGTTAIGTAGKLTSPLIIATGTAPTASGTCSINAQVGGMSAGKFAANGACASGTVILTFGTAATNGWACQASDLTTPADALNQTAYTTTTVTFTGTLVSGDLVTWSCVGF